jgi:transcriptional regulator with XRE-family HTH domain
MIERLKEIFYKKVAFNLYTIRMSQNMTQEDLSFKSNVERSKISRIENAKEDFFFYHLNLAEALEVFSEDILNTKIEMPSDFFNARAKLPQKRKSK